MKLRNKKTGEIIEGKIEIPSYGECAWKQYNFDSLAELNAEWEDYEPKEPLIKDEKIRKAVRAWAEANQVSSVYCWYVAIGKFCFEDIRKEQICIEFIGEKPIFETIKDSYTIAELCGEEE